MEMLPAKIIRWSVMLPFCWALVLAGFLPSRMVAQDTLPVVELHMEHLGVKEGLSAGMVYKIAQDQKGYLWLATSEGLNRYDGYRIKTYEHNANDSLSLPEDHVTNVFVDSRNWLWLTTRNKGLAVMDFESESFFPLDVPGSENPSYNIKEDQWGNIWIIGGKPQKVVQIPPEMRSPSALKDFDQSLLVRSPHEVFRGLPKGAHMQQVVLSQQHGLWFLHKDSLVNYKLDFENKSAQLQLSYPVDRGGSIDVVRRKGFLIEDVANDRLLFFGGRHVYEIDPTTGAVQKMVSLPPNPEFLIRHEVLVPHIVDRRSQVWCSSIDGQYGIYVLDLKTGHWKPIKRAGAKKIILELGLSNRILEDRHGVIWFPTSGYGAFKHTPAHAAFNYCGNEHEGPSLGSFVDLRHRQIGQIRGENSFLDLGTGKFANLFDNDQLGGYLISLVRDDNGHIWISSGTSLNPATFQLHKYDSTEKLLQQFPRRKLQEGPFAAGDLLFGADRTLWSVVSNNLEMGQTYLPHVYLDCWQPEGTASPRRFVFEAPSNGYVFGKCQAIIQGADRNIWIGLNEGGLLVFDPQRESWRHFSYLPSDSSSIPSNRVYSILPDPQAPLRTMWVGTSKGLAKMDIASGTFTTITPEQGLPDEVIYGILADERDNLWLSTNHGLCRFDPVAMDMQIYTEEDGLQHTEFNRRAYLKNADGTLFFGGVGGLTSFDPEDLYVESPPAVVVINGIRLNNESVEFLKPYLAKEDPPVLEAPVEYLSEIVLDYHQRFLTFEFTALDLTRPSNNRYRCKLEGFSDSWTAPSSQPEITFTNLAPGSYTFWVQGSNYQGEWNEQYAKVDLRIRPPWWGTWWFRLSTLLLVGAGIYAFIRFRMQTKQNLLAIRNRISADLHDEIGSTLSSISLFGLVAERSIDSDPKKAHQLLKRINSNAMKTTESMNDIVWAIKSENDSMLHLINRMRGYASEIEDTREWDIQIRYDSGILEHHLDMIQRRNIYLIFKEAVNNAIKYSEGDAINIEIKWVKGLKHIEIKDNGKGFDPEKIQENGHWFGGNGLKNMERRATELGGKLQIISAPGQGTSVVLFFNPSHAPKTHWVQ